MDKSKAKTIIQNAVEVTKPRWEQYAESWKNIDTVFILRGYEQQGFELFKMRKVLEQFGILSIDHLGGILLRYPERKSYNREFAGSDDSEFYLKLRKGASGQEGKLFANAAQMFLVNKLGNPGRTYRKLLYELLQACTVLKKKYSSSFARYAISKYEVYSGRKHVTENDFLNVTVAEWDVFLKRSKPWVELMGIGPNVFDFIFGDIKEARFAENSYKFDSSNQYFLNVTGIAKLIEPFDRETTSHFLPELNVPYTLREINKGIYTYCSKTEGSNYGFCYNRQKCEECKVIDLCDKNINSSNRRMSGHMAKKSKPDILPQIQKKYGDAFINSSKTSRIWARLDQSKYKIEEIFKNQYASDLSIRLLYDFYRKFMTESEIKNEQVTVKTHNIGFTYFTKKGKAFIFMDVRRKFIWIRFYTGDKNIEGLKKANWILGGDNKGSETFRIIDDDSLKQAINFGLKSNEIAKMP